MNIQLERTFLTTDKPITCGTLQLQHFHKVWYWEPKEDITTFELAKCQSMLIAGATGNYDQLRTIYNSLPANCQRHWRQA